MLRTKLFVKYFPLDEEKVRYIDKKDKEALIHIFRNGEREINAEGFFTAEQARGIFPFRMMFFSVTKYHEILQGYENEITANDIDIMNMLLYRNKYIYPISLFF